MFLKSGNSDLLPSLQVFHAEWLISLSCNAWASSNGYSCARGNVQRRLSSGHPQASPPTLYLDVAIKTPPLRPFSSPLVIQFHGLDLATGMVDIQQLSDEILDLQY